MKIVVTINKKITKAQTSDMLTDEETKKILTPFAFNIDESLFGLPLALPWRRGAALLLDFLIIAMLAATPGEFLALVAAITFFKLGSKKRAKKLGKKRGLRKLMLRGLGAFIIFVLLVTTIPDFIKTTFNQQTKSIENVLDSDDGANKQASEPKELKSSENIKISDTKPVVVQSEDEKVQIEKQSIQVNQVNNETEASKLLYKGLTWAQGVIKDLGLSFGWAALYFTVLTSIWRGQTPGKKTFKIKVIQLDGTPLSIWDSFGRYGGYGAGLATGLLGFLQIYWDPNRQAIHDKISATIVIDLKKLSEDKANETV